MTDQQTKVFQEMLDGYTLCGCCGGHQAGKPGVWDPSELMAGCVTKHSKNGCKCACRHNARALCRVHPDYNAAFDPEWPFFVWEGGPSCLAGQVTKAPVFSVSDCLVGPWG